MRRPPSLNFGLVFGSKLPVWFRHRRPCPLAKIDTNKSPRTLQVAAIWQFYCSLPVVPFAGASGPFWMERDQYPNT